MFLISRAIRHLTTGCIVTIAWSGAAMAQPEGLPSLIVVADVGGEPARPYFVAIGGSGVPEHEWIQAARTAPYAIDDMLPVETPTLSPGRVERRSLSMPPGFSPLFIVGDDPASLSWLAARGQTLLQMGASGLAVNVQSADSLQMLLDVVPGLRIDPVPGDELANRLELTHYPVLITAAGLEQ